MPAKGQKAQLRLAIPLLSQMGKGLTVQRHPQVLLGQLFEPPAGEIIIHTPLQKGSAVNTSTGRNAGSSQGGQGAAYPKGAAAAGTDANPEAEATSFTVHYYKEGTTDKVRRDTVYQNLAVGAGFTASAPTVKGYKALAASAEITVTADGEHIFYYSVDESTAPGGSDDDPSKPGFFDGLLSSVKSLVNVICGFVGGVVQSLLSGITGIISTLIDAFKAVLSLGGHFGDFLAAALGFVPREIIDLLIAGIAVSIALAIIKFIRG